MKCPRCQADNPADTKFSGQCAAPLIPACPGEACQQRSRGRTERPQRASGAELTELSWGAAMPRSGWLALEGGALVDAIRLRAVRGGG